MRTIASVTWVLVFSACQLLLPFDESAARGSGAVRDGMGGGSGAVTAPGSGDGADSGFAAPTSQHFDVVVVGAGAGGVSAAIEAARMGMRVALLDETGHVGGQLLSVTAMDEGTGQVDGGNVLHTQGLYGELVAQMRAHYGIRPLGTCHWSDVSVAWEAADAEEVLRDMLAKAGVTLAASTEVVSAHRDMRGGWALSDSTGGTWESTIVIDGTEYGDLMPLAHVAYRVGNGKYDPKTGEQPPLGACVQEITATLPVREFPSGIPPPLDLTGGGPPGGIGGEWPFRSGYWVWNFALTEADGGYCSSPAQHWTWNCHNGYRGTPDRDNPVPYLSSSGHVTKTTINAVNDYPNLVNDSDSGYPVSAIEDRAVRRREECRAKLMTLQLLYYAQNPVGAGLGQSWAASDEVSRWGFMALCDPAIIPSRYDAITRLFPRPYVREARRMIGVHTLTGPDVERVPTPSNAMWPFAGRTPWESAVATGFYSMDLHACWAPSTLEPQLLNHTVTYLGPGGPFQIPMGALIARDVDGFLAVEKNISTSRLANGAVRLQPTSMATGQAAGALAAIAVQRGVEPRAVSPVLVQRRLLDQGTHVSQSWFSDVPLGHPYFKAVQLSATHGVLGGSGSRFLVADALTRAQAAVLLQRTLRYPLGPLGAVQHFADVPPGDWAFPFVEALFAAGLTVGCGNGNYCPTAATTRAELAVFLGAGLNVPLPPCAAKPFDDVGVRDAACPMIAELKRRGLVSACRANDFCPGDAVSRGLAAQISGDVIAHLASEGTVPAGACWRTPPDFCGR